MSERPDDDLVSEEEAAAADAARRIGGTAGDEHEYDPALRPVYEAGGGEQEGFELAEHDLIENAQHGEGHGDPEVDAFRPEVESDLAGAEYGDPDGEDEERPGPDVGRDR
jgi:hypothetical protein